MQFATASFAADFNAMDTDANNVISEVEFVAAYTPPKGATLTAADVDKSGALGEAENALATDAGVLPSE